ncbi:putative ABC transporter ATP-binding protein [Streptomyces kurssanovii]|nr:putative ABC transporter ATP-binding protein [Streptomyces kurssanovii]
MNLPAMIRGNRSLLIAAAAAGLLGTAASLAQPLVIGQLIKAAAADQSLTGPIAAAGALFCADAVLAALEAYLVGRAGEGIVFNIRRALTDRVLRSSIPAFRQLDHGDVFTRLVTDTSLARVALAQSLSQLITSTVMVIGCLTLMAWTDLQLLLLTLASLGCASGLSLVLARRIRLAAVTNRKDTSAFGSGIQRVLGALTTVKAARAEQREQQRLAGLANEARRSGVRVNALAAMLTPAINVGTQISLTVVIGWGMTRVATGALPLSDLTTFVMYLFYVVAPLVALFLAIADLQQGRAAISRLRELDSLDTEEDTDTPPQHPLKDDLRSPALEFDGVSFSYPRQPVLSSTSFTVPARGITAIVGPSGAGKTTLFQLIERFEQPQHGTVRLNGNNIQDIPLDRLRKVIAYVEQDHALMRGTLRENITYACPDATDEEIAHALDQVGLTQELADLPDGLETPLGERGGGLSGGQRQRIAVARALLAKPRIVLLDEATAHLDAKAEAALGKTIREIAQHCSVITIAHRLSTVVGADQIIVLESGSVRAVGTHAALLQHDSLYQHLAAQQFKANALVGDPA